MGIAFETWGLFLWGFGPEQLLLEGKVPILDSNKHQYSTQKKNAETLESWKWLGKNIIYIIIIHIPEKLLNIFLGVTYKPVHRSDVGHPRGFFKIF